MFRCQRTGVMLLPVFREVKSFPTFSLLFINTLPKCKVMAVIRYWGRHEIEEDCADKHGISKQSLSHLGRKVAILLVSKSSQYIKMLDKVERDAEVGTRQDPLTREIYRMLGFNSAGVPDKSWQPSGALLETTMGAITVEMYWKHAPLTCKNFMELVRRGYYNNTKFHRVIRDFMIQGGDPTGTGKGGQSIYGLTFDDEISNDLKHTGAGILSMANSGPNTNGSQYFITLAPTQWLDGQHTIFGRVCDGMHVVKRIGLIECDKDDCPVDDIRIEKATVVKQIL